MIVISSRMDKSEMPRGKGGRGGYVLGNGWLYCGSQCKDYSCIYLYIMRGDEDNCQIG